MCICRALGSTALAFAMATAALLPGCGNQRQGATDNILSVSPIGLGFKNLMILYVPSGQSPPATESLGSVNYYPAFSLGTGVTATAASSGQAPVTDPNQSPTGSLYLYAQDADQCTNCAFNITLGLTYQQGPPSIVVAYAPSPSSQAPLAPNLFSSEAVHLGSGVDAVLNASGSTVPTHTSTGELYLYMQCPKNLGSCGQAQPGHGAAMQQKGQ